VKADPVTGTRARRLNVDESPSRRADTVSTNIRIPRALEQAYKDRGDELGIPYSTLMRRVLEAYYEQVLEEETVISPDEDKT